MRYFFIIFTLILTGCAANPFSEYYYDRTNGEDITKNQSFVISTEQPKLFSGSDIEADFQMMLEDGYEAIGYSQFNAGNVTEQQAIDHAKAVHAEIVLFYSKFTNTISGVVPLRIPDTQTSTTTEHGYVYGSGGGLEYSGTATTTTHGTHTTFIPVSYDRYDYFAGFWVKRNTPIFGTVNRELTLEERKIISGNQGIMIEAVIKGSPAFKADLLKGDILKRIGTVEINDLTSYQNALLLSRGKEITVVFFRDGRELSKQVILNQGN